MNVDLNLDLNLAQGSPGRIKVKTTERNLHSMIADDIEVRKPLQSSNNNRLRTINAQLLYL